MIVGFWLAAFRSCITATGRLISHFYVGVDWLNKLDSNAVPEQYMIWFLALQDRIHIEYGHENICIAYSAIGVRVGAI